jgi:uncharacterized protein with PIN domain
MKKSLNSPCCAGAIANLRTRMVKITIGETIFEDEFYFYECEKCGEGWTTTESDTESLKKIDKIF